MDDASEIKGLEALHSEIAGLAGDIPPGKAPQEILEISERILREQRERLVQMEGADVRLFEDEIQHGERVMVLVDDEQDKVQQLFKDVQECYEPFFEIKAGVYDGRAYPTVDLAPAEALWTRAEDLFSRTNNNAEEMMARCSHDIALVRKHAEEELRQRLEEIMPGQMYCGGGGTKEEKTEDQAD